jgi:trans-aconitate 2-methyltransferase
MAVDWQAESYHRVSGPMEAMGLAVLERLELAGDETVLDAGCGTGRVTAHLVERLPHGRVIAVDRAPSMVAQARANLAALGDRVEVHEADLLELEVPEPVDAILSTATFHWVLDHERLFDRLFAALRPGGRLVAQCGGHGNIARVLAAALEVGQEEPFTGAFDGWRRASHFASAEQTEERLLGSGFGPARAWLEPWPIEPDDPVEYLTTITLRDHMSRISDDQQLGFATRVVERLGAPVVLDYVRLNIEAAKPE